MKNFILVIASLVVVLIVVGAFWHLNVQKEHAFDYYQKELAKRDKIMSKYNDLIHRIWIDRPTYVEEILSESREFAEWDETVGENWKDEIFCFHNSDDSLAYYNNWDRPDWY